MKTELQRQLSEWKQLGFSLEITQDGSPTLRLLDQFQVNSNKTESMHHSGGAFAESLYIYGEIIDEVMKKFQNLNRPMSVLSLGLGLGYNELLVAAYALKYNYNQALHLYSFEVVDGLKQAFVNFCFHKCESSEIYNTYQLMLEFYEKKFNVGKNEILKYLQELYKNNNWVIQSDFLNQSEKTNCHVILYDAFSGKTNQELWDEGFLTEKINLISADDVLFATYACRASLKKALKSTDYELVIRDGFLGKRNSTQARRGIFKRALQTS